jgi:hypothetical protein
MPCSHPPIPRSPGKNWIERIPGGQIPEEIDCVARALYHGNTEAKGQKQKAYHMAVGIAQDWAAGRRGISKEKQAKYAAAIVKWEALKKAAHADDLSTPLDLARASAAELARYA